MIDENLPLTKIQRFEERAGSVRTHTALYKGILMKKVVLNIDEIKNLIPHREPMLLLNQVTIVSLTEAESVYSVSGDEFFLQGHYPGNPIVPGNILSEMLAQLGAVLICYHSSMPECVYHNLRKGKIPVIARLNDVRFQSPVKPGDIMRLRIVITKDTGLVVTAEAHIAIGDTIAVSEEIIVAFI